MIMRLYKSILWFLGFAKGEYITYMMQRQEKRLGVLWWLLIAATLAIITIELHTWTSQLLFSVLIFPLNFTVILLVWHVVKSPGAKQATTIEK